MKMTRLIVSLSLALSLVFAATSLWAAAEFHPYLTVEEEYNDNIYLSDSGEEEDWITRIEPGVRFTYTNRSVAATLDYSLHYSIYKDNSDENLNDFKDVQRADASVLFFSGRPFTLRLTETISREALDERDRGADYNEIVNRSTVYHTTVTPEYRLQLVPTFSLVFGYTYDRFDYVESQGIDTAEHEGRVSLVKEMSANSQLYARYAYSVLQSDEAADEYDRHDYTVGLTQHIGGRTTLSLEGGYGDVEYDSGLDTDSLTWLVNVTYQLSEPLAFNLGYSQDFETTALDGLTKLREANLGATYTRDTLTASAELFWNNSDYVRQNREDEAYGFRFDVTKPLARALTVSFDGEYERSQYDDPGVSEDVDRYTVGTSLDYAYRRFVASLGYRYRINESDDDNNDYANNIVTLSGTVRF